MKRLALSAALGLTLGSSATADDSAHWLTFDYHAHQQVTIPCPVAQLCTLTFAPGEVLGDWFHSNAGAWHPSTSSSGSGVDLTPQLVVEPSAPNLKSNFVVFAKNTGRTYAILFVSTNDARPTYARFTYPQPRRAPKAVATPVPMVADFMAAACKTSDGYTVDAAPANLRPVQACSSATKTYVRLPAVTSAVVDLPMPYESSPSGSTSVNHRFEEASRIFELDTVADVELRYSSGKHGLTLHVKRVAAPPPAPVKATAARLAPVPIAQVTADPVLSSMLEAHNAR
jgi:type IV secretory pathway VirB9-like protein